MISLPPPIEPKLLVNKNLPNTYGQQEMLQHTKLRKARKEFFLHPCLHDISLCASAESGFQNISYHNDYTALDGSCRGICNLCMWWTHDHTKTRTSIKRSR